MAGRGLVVLHRGGVENPVVFAMSTSYMLLALTGLLLLTYIVIRLWLTRTRRLARRERWDGGVRRLLPEMTYTATGFSNPVRVIFDAIFRPTTVEDTSETVAEHFRMAIRREKERVHLVDRLVFQPQIGGAVVRARSGGDAPRAHQRLRDLCISGSADRVCRAAGIVMRASRADAPGGRGSYMTTDGSLLVLVFALCGVGALAGLAVPERRIPAFLAWVGSLAALAMLWVSADVLRSGGAFRSKLWAIRPLEP